jgi:hypothetical protein
MRLGRGRVLEGLWPVRNSIWVMEEGETHHRGVSMAAGGRPVRMPERGRSVGRGSRQSDRGGALHRLDARGVGGVGERRKSPTPVSTQQQMREMVKCSWRAPERLNLFVDRAPA